MRNQPAAAPPAAQAPASTKLASSAVPPSALLDQPVDRSLDPLRLAEIVLAVALRGDADAVFVEPDPTTPDVYTLTYERGRQPIAQASVDARAGTALIARLAYLAELDLASSSPSSGLLSVRSGARRGEVVVTIRPGASLRADVMVVPPPVTHKRTQTEVAIEAGDMIGHFKVLRQLGKGGMGAVYLVEQALLGRRYALKVLDAREFRQDERASQQFLREARAAARVRHPNIVDVFDFGRLPDGRPFFVMELLEGITLHDLVADEPLSIRDVALVGRQLTSALATVHDVGVVHADVTLSNVMVTSRSPLTVKLVDFGLSTISGEPLADRAEGDPDADVVFGTPAFISPEQLCGLPATDRSDQYSLGCVLYSLLAGHPPYEHDSIHELCRMHLQAPIPGVKSPYGPVPPKLADVITTCLQKSPKHRFPSVRAMLAVFDDITARMTATGWQRWLT